MQIAANAKEQEKGGSWNKEKKQASCMIENKQVGNTVEIVACYLQWFTANPTSDWWYRAELCVMRGIAFHNCQQINGFMWF